MKIRAYFIYSLLSFLFLLCVLVFHFNITCLPLFCLLLGVTIRVIFSSDYLLVFSFLIPVLPGLASLGNNGFPRNYLLLPLFVLCGIIIGDFAARKERRADPLPELPGSYFAFLLLLGVSFIFVMLRWSNLTLSILAFFKDTPIAPNGQRISFGIIFPVLELALFSLSPLYYLLLKRQHDLRRILIAFLAGQSFSIFISLFHCLQGKNPYKFPVYGLSSDATAFGFLSALAVLLSWYLYFHYNCKKTGLLYVFISLLGVLNSSTRVGLLALVLVFLLFIFSAKKRVLSFFVITAFMGGLLLLYLKFFYQPGFNLVSRLRKNYGVFDKSLGHEEVDLQTAAKLVDKRDILYRYSWELARTFPLTGVGTGNYIFWVMRAHPNDYFHHLPANQYFFILSSSGLPGLFMFLLFCSGLFSGKKWPEKILLGMFLFLLIFNDYLWFPEIFLTFWLFVSFGEKNEEKHLIFNESAKIICFFGLAVFVLFNLLKFSALHPKNWALQTATPYDYGFSYPEREGGRTFRWSGAAAGIYVYPGKGSGGTEYVLNCGAPLAAFRGRRQVVEVYWRGKLYESVEFRDNGRRSVRIADAARREGFLEFRVHPTFNMKKMGLNEETRTLGVQVAGPGL